MHAAQYATKTLILSGTCIAILTGCCGVRPLSPQSPALRTVAQYKGIFTEPPSRVPTGAVVDGPILGNGDIGVALAGPPQRQLFHIGKNDFWSHHWKLVTTVGGVSVEIPALHGASYRQEQVLAQAEVRGEFETPLAKLQTTNWTAEGENLLVTELKSESQRPIRVDVRNWAGTLNPIRDNDSHIRLGCEQKEDGRWFFDGVIDEVRIYSEPLTPEEARLLHRGKPVRDALVRHWDFSEGGGPTAHDVAGQGYAGRPLDGAEWAQTDRGLAMGFDGRKASFDAGPLRLDRAVTLAAWIRPDSLNLEKEQANYILSKGEWNQAYSLGLSVGRPRFSAGEVHLDAPSVVPTGEWTHVAGTYDGQMASLYVNGHLVAQSARGSMPADSGLSRETLWVTRSANPDGVEGRTAAIATRVIGVPVESLSTPAGNALRFEIGPEQRVFLVSAILSDLDAPSGPRDAALRRVEALDPSEIDALRRRHDEWWRDFWSESYVEIGDPLIEGFYYGAQYIMASCSRTGKVAPGLFGNWITNDYPGWRGDYHLNYNFEAPYWGVYSSNHVALADSYDPPLIDFMPIAKDFAARFLDMPGTYFPVGIGPWGIHSDPNFWRQKSNGAYATTNMIMRWRHTYDTDYLRRCAYPFLIETANFWEGYLRFENDRYRIYNDAIHEGERGSVNPILSLGLLRTLFATLIEASEALDVDAERRPQWKHILEHLPEYTYQELQGKKVFRYTEVGMDWCYSNTLGIQHVWPGGAIGLDSDPALLQVARDTVTVLDRWTDYNGYPTIFTAAARVGYDPEIILEKMRTQMEHHSFPNFFIYFGGGGIETCGGTTSAVNEMLLQSHEGVLRLFPVWPKDRPARFGTLRAVGAFLVSSALEGGTVRYVRISSEKGRDCTVQNPWPEGRAVLWRRSGASDIFEGERFTFSTRVGEEYFLLPEGVEPEEVSSEVD